MSNKQVVAATGFFAALLAGCNPAPLIKTVPVSGTITYQGRPVKEAIVNFMNTAEGGRSAIGVTDQEGRFTLQTPVSGSRHELGAVEGTYKVLVVSDVRWPQEVPPGTDPASLTQDDLRDLRNKMSRKAVQFRQQRDPLAMKREMTEILKSALPEQYSAIETTDLLALVRAGEANTFVFELSAKPATPDDREKDLADQHREAAQRSPPAAERQAAPRSAAADNP